MNIIIDPDKLEEVRAKYTVLELDTIRLVDENNRLVHAYCLVENIPIVDLPKIPEKKELHHNLMVNYRLRDWNYCLQAIDSLMGSWNGELDTFYDDVRRRIDKYMQQDPGDTWDGTIPKTSNSHQ